MRNILKGFQNPEAQPYVLPKADLSENGEFDLLDPALAAELKAIEKELQEEEELLPPVEEVEVVEEILPEEPVEEPVSQPDPVEYAQVQAESIIAEARAVADEILANVEVEALDELELLRSGARDEGYRDGYARGMMDAAEQSKEEQEAYAEALNQQVKDFLEDASTAREQMIADTVEELRDLAIAVAEKVVRVSLKTSSEVIVRMIRSATDKLKRREWMHIYISGCDQQGLAEISPALSLSMSAMSEHVRIIPMKDDELGTCIIETPEEIIDASLSTQVNNIRNLVFDQGSSRDTGVF
ncbi:MAG: FliH/SctL family protein [Eubacteriales bacterium]